MNAEINAYIAKFEELNNQVKKLLDEVPPEALDWRPIKGEGDLATNSFGVLAAHLAGSQTYWMREMIGGQRVRRDRDAEFATKGKTAAELQALLDNAAKNVREVLSSLKPAQLEDAR